LQLLPSSANAAVGLDGRHLLHAAHWALDTSSACERPTNVKKPALRPILRSDLAKVDAHVIRPQEYEELPELTTSDLQRAVVKKRGRPVSPNPRQLISIRLPADVIERWRATGPGWQTRMAERQSKVR
jgi:uncharacterized protein (DUF4415 family)